MAITQKWKDTVNQGVSDARWDAYDELVKKQIAAFNQRFSSTPNYAQVDWLYIKAMLWIESGGPDNASWKTRPMQIGNPGDPAFSVLKEGKEGSLLVMEPAVQQALKAGRINDPEINIKAGIAYLFTRLAKFANKSAPDPRDSKVYEHTVAKGDSLWSIANAKGTTLEELNARNPGTTAHLKPGQVLKYTKTKMELTIVGWRGFTAQEIAQRYNVGDPDYSAKITYLMKDVFPKLNRPAPDAGIRK